MLSTVIEKRPVKIGSCPKLILLIGRPFDHRTTFSCCLLHENKAIMKLLYSDSLMSGYFTRDSDISVTGRFQ